MAPKLPRLTKASLTRRRRRSPFVIGAVALAVTAIAMVALFNRPAVETFLRPGETIAAEFSANHNRGLVANETDVEVSGLEVGVVDDIEYTDDGTVLVSMKVDKSVVDSLGAKPSAVVRPATVLGGKYSVTLRHGGGRSAFEDGFIPQDRTRTPVELDRILEALPDPTRQSVRDVVNQLDDTLNRGGQDALRDLMADAPQTLRPAGTVLEAAQGTRPGVDLPRIVRNFHSMADVLSQYEGQLGGIVTDLSATTAVLAEQSQPLADGIESLPGTLRATRTGVTDLSDTLDKLTVTADSFRPAARELDPLLRELDPVLRKARPLLRDLRPLLRDARPLVQQLVPVAQRGTQVLGHLRGPVLDRVNGPISDTVMNVWEGSGPYKDSGGGEAGPEHQRGHTFYQELGYMATNLDRGAMTQDAQGSLLGFQAGANTRSVVGTPFTLPNLIAEMKKVTGGSR